jgi:tellurium resistance protein TerD
MAINLQKGRNVNLSKTNPGLRKIVVGLGWDLRTTDGVDFDLDASAFMLNDTDKVVNENDFVFYKNLTSSDGSVEHTGDNKTGAGDGDDEQLKVDLSKVSADVTKVAFTVTIHEADARRQNFGQVRNAFIRVVNAETNEELARYDLSEDASTETAMNFGELYKHNGEWKFRAVGQGYAGGLAALCENYGLQVG